MLAGLASFAALLGADSRGAMLFTILATAVILSSRGRHVRIAQLVVVASPAFSFVMLHLSRALHGGTFNELSRGTTLLSNRELIWHNAFALFSQLARHDPIRLLIGYGYLGQVTSGVSRRYFGSVDAFLNVANPAQASLHRSGASEHSRHRGRRCRPATGGLRPGAVRISCASAERRPPTVLLCGSRRLRTDLTMNVYSYHVFFPLVFLMVLASTSARGAKGKPQARGTIPVKPHGSYVMRRPNKP